MATPKVFNNVIIGQFALTGVPLKVYVNGIYLTITDIDDVENSSMGFGMDVDGRMQRFGYNEIEHLSVAGNQVTIDAYNKGMEAKFSGDEEAPEEEPAEEPKKEESTMKLGDILKEISQDEVDAEVEGAEAQIDASKAKLKAAQAAMKTTIKVSKEKIKAAKSQPIDDGYTAGVDDGKAGKSLEEDRGYTFGTGDIIKNINPKCKHFGSQGIVKGVQDMDDGTKVAIYTVTNSGDTYSPGMTLTKTIDQLEPIQKV